MNIRTLILLMLLLPAFRTMAQEHAIIHGRVSDPAGKPMQLVNVSILGTQQGTTTSQQGTYSLKIPVGQEVTVVFSFLGYQSVREKFLFQTAVNKEVNKTLQPVITEIDGFEVKDDKVNRSSNLIRINPKTATIIPSASGSGVESLIKTMPGVASNNELSSQYSVRGGNYDENLVYVNDIEIYRPFLVRSGQQEGLSFLNSDLVSNIQFSAGGFDAKYGEKMSSVLDIQYKKPVDFAGSVSMSLLGAAFHLEGAAARKKLNYLLGIRQKSNQYVLNSLQTKGEYKPSFTDVQAFLNFHINKKLELSFLGNYARNLFRLVPQDRETAFGTLVEAYQFKVYFEGQEKDRFENYLGALSLNYRPRSRTSLKFIASAFRTLETERFDILGQYYLSRLETDWGSDEFGKAIEPIGVGSYLNHARNELDARVFNIEQRGTVERDHRFFQWGVKYQREEVYDKLREWTLLDSAGYALPHQADSVGYVIPGIQPYDSLLLQNVIRSKNEISSNRYTCFIQNTWSWLTDSTRLTLTAGIRCSYWDLNDQFLAAPRVSLSYKPAWEKDVVFRLSGGAYHQPPFYRELRDRSGNINEKLKAQSSYQLVAGSDWDFRAWQRPFKFVTEVYYKYLDKLVPYEVDNVRIRYSARNNARGYAVGIDFRVNGEFVKGTESWASLSVMQTREDILDDYYYTDDGVKVEPGFIPRPTDQRVNFNLFFQDYLPQNPTYKMYLNLVFGSTLRFGPPDSPRYLHTYKIPPYKRVDIGFSKQIKGETSLVSQKSLLRHFKSMWISLEIFNLLQISNTVSYFWVADITNRQYAIPNYLTPRQLNLKLYAQF
ncbi:MAG TPA: carboxypeptidase-like regulatory domain-containing protein [Bacteroidales bacterium]|nr:carboxypeptidase-like regulatory domain-containing protein [Bacteroidales bacterium]HSA43547.1 carboxypeptidase-like regulatory domain-containing protein [Bacteroidales bacterium]